MPAGEYTRAAGAEGGATTYIEAVPPPHARVGWRQTSAEPRGGSPGIGGQPTVAPSATVTGGAGGPKWGCREWCTRFGASESIYKISHTKRSHCKRNPDRLRRLRRPRLHIGRRVYERGHSRQPAKRERQRAHKLCRAASWQPLGGDVRHCRAPLQVQDTALNTQFIPHRACVAPYGLPGFGRSRCKPNPRPPRAPALGGAGGERRGRRSLTVDPEGWALWVTGRCLSLMQSLWGYARGGSFALKSLATPPLGALRCCP